MKNVLIKMLAILYAVAPAFVTQSGEAAEPGKSSPREIVLVLQAALTPTGIAGFKSEGFRGVAIIVDETSDKAALEIAAKAVADEGLDLYVWVEIARNPRLADEHPRWMASLGMHDDWQKRFPKSRLPREDEVAKAWPWVPITYREAFDAHLKRIDLLLQRLPGSCRGLLLNDLQGGPASCGCGNLQCRWATDYQVSATGTRIESGDAAAQFVSEVRKRTGSRLIIPVWTTECEDADLPASRRRSQPSTGLCGSVGCATGLCPKEFTRQWSALLRVLRDDAGPVGVLALHHEFDRAGKLYSEGAAWLTNAVKYLDEIPLAHGGPALPGERLWIVVEGAQTEEIATRQRAAKVGASHVVVARTRIDQSYEPRLIPAK